MVSKRNTETKQDRRLMFMHSLSTFADLLGDLRSGLIRSSTYTACQEYAQSYGLKYTVDERLIVGLGLESDFFELREAAKLYQRMKHREKSCRRWAKRIFVVMLNLHGMPRPFREMDVKTLCRNHDHFLKLKSRTRLLDRGHENLRKQYGPGHKSYIVDDRNGWYTVQPDESCVFLNDDGTFKPYDVVAALTFFLGKVELAILRNITGEEKLLDRVNEVIEEAIKDRRNVRPEHPGSMVQYGWNAGSRSCRVWGLVNNFKNAAKFGEDEKIVKDRNILGVMSLTWHLFRSHAPAEVVESVEASIAEAGLPKTSGLYDEDKHGYSFNYLGYDMTFPYVSRAPCEGYFAQNYAAPLHTDKNYAEYSFTWITAGSNDAYGGNYIDVTLGVRVRPARDTLMIFRPEFLHGTTLCKKGVKRMGVVITFTTRIKDAYDKSVQKLKKGIICDLEPFDVEK